MMSAVAAGLVLAATDQADPRPLKVFILAGQPTMEGSAGMETFDYLGHDLRTGLLSTWLHPLHETNQEPKGASFTDIEGGLGWWRDKHFPMTTPKFILGGVVPLVFAENV